MSSPRSVLIPVLLTAFLTPPAPAQGPQNPNYIAALAAAQEAAQQADPLELRGALHEAAKESHRRRGDEAVWTMVNAAERAGAACPQGSSCSAVDLACCVLDIYRNAHYHPRSRGASDSRQTTCSINGDLDRTDSGIVRMIEREHSWSTSYGFPGRSRELELNGRRRFLRSFPYTDGHHIFAADDSYNSARGNAPFGELELGPDELPNWEEKPTVLQDQDQGTCQERGGLEPPGDSNWRRTGGLWRTWDERKGDVARALFYLDVRYESRAISGDSESDLYRRPELKLTNDIQQIDRCRLREGDVNTRLAYMGILDTLIEWHTDDWVDERERRRNAEIELQQGNRNPFIDDPSGGIENQTNWVHCLYQGHCFGVETTGMTPTEQPGQPQLEDAGTNRISWSRPNEAPPETRYIVYRGETIDGAPCTCPDERLTLQPLSETFFEDSTAQPGTDYCYSVTAVTIRGVESSQSPVLSLTTAGDSTRPTKPTGLVASSGDGVVALDWDDNTTDDDHASFDLFRREEVAAAARTTASPPAKTLNDTPVRIASGLTASEHVDTDVVNGRVYYYHVTAIDSSGNESLSSAEVRGTPRAARSAPSAPLNLTAHGQDGVVNLDWIIVLNPDQSTAGFNIYRSEGTADTFQFLAGVSLSASYEDTTAENGTSYFYLVRAVGASGVESPDSNVAGATPRRSSRHVGASQWYEEPDDYRFVVDRSQDLDTGCTFNTQQPSFRIDLPVERYFGRTLPGGHLDPELIANGYVAPTAFLVMPAFDVDEPSEVDAVFFNGRFIGNLEGANNVWTYNVFPIPVEDLIEFPTQPGWQRDGSTEPRRWGGPPEPAVNRVEIFIDTLFRGRWCTEVDWIALYIDGIYPVVFFHGFGADESAWIDAGATERLEELGVPFRTDISLPEARDSIQSNGEDVDHIVRETLASFGANRFHLVGHSKGGVDSRSFLASSLPSTNAANPDQALEALSLQTLSTPHHGTVLPALPGAGIELLVSRFTDDPFAAELIDSLLSRQIPGAGEVTPAFMDGTFNPTHPAPSIFLRTAGSDAVTRAGDDWITCPEGQQMVGAYLPDHVILSTVPSWVPNWVRNLTPRCIAVVAAGTGLYQANAYLTQVEVGISGPATSPRYEVREVEAGVLLENDLVVSERSSRLGSEEHWVRNANANITEPEDALDHSAIKDPEAMDWILEGIRTAFPHGSHPFESPRDP